MRYVWCYKLTIFLVIIRLKATYNEFVLFVMPHLFNEQFRHLFVDIIISIDELNKLPRCIVNAIISCCGDTIVLFVNNTDTLIFIFPRFAYFFTAVGRAIIN